MVVAASSLSKLVPGFDFLEGLAKSAGSAMPDIGQWVAPTLDPAELDKRIEELRTVQYWLEQNARLLGTTIQALEVQRMTLSTLQNMNVQMTDLRDALMAPAPKPARSAPDKPAAAKPPPAPKPSAPAAPAAPAAAQPAAPAVDPMQWWTALTQQFTELANSALKNAGEAAPAAPAQASAPRKPARKTAAKSRSKPA